jgi:gliding motility-associated-like protein
MAFIHVKVVECTEMYIPNAFTPNGDGMNDVFLAKSNLDLDYFQMNIYTADGRQILFSSKDIHKGWDGTYRGQRLPHGVYFYNIRYKDNFGKIVEKRGELLLILQ